MLSIINSWENHTRALLVCADKKSIILVDTIVLNWKLLLLALFVIFCCSMLIKFLCGLLYLSSFIVFIFF